MKTGGISAGKRALEAARARGLKTMLGCMIESSVLITAGAHLARLTDYLDLDGNLLITNDPYSGVRCGDGRLTFAGVRGVGGTAGCTPVMTPDSHRDGASFRAYRAAVRFFRPDAARIGGL